MQIKTTCPDCGSKDLEFQCRQTTRSAAGDGQLKLNEIDTLFVLGCTNCSETVQTMSGDDMAQALTDQLQKGA